MSLPNPTSLKVKNYKSFGSDEQGFDRIAPMNIIIGRNNSGKSALLDLIEYAVVPHDLSPQGHVGRSPEVFFTTKMSEAMIQSAFPSNMANGPDIVGNHFDYGKRWIGETIKVALDPAGAHTLASLEGTVGQMPPGYAEQIAKKTVNPFKALTFRRINAERDIAPETPGGLGLTASGAGATNIIQNFLNASNADQRLVENKLLNALNEVFFPDAKFTRIQTKRLPDSDQWEIFLEEQGKGNIALSNSGSGLKTIILVLVQTILMPKIDNRELNEYVFGFEELENNLHPGLQRRLFNFLRKLAEDEGATFFVTTHSNVVIDLFSGDDQAQLLHVTHNQKDAQVQTLIDYAGNSGVLDDLDVRASDILQSNAIVWVEGPSDRVYLNRFIELMSDGEVREGAHYQCVFYGGRLLAQVSADPKNDEHVNLLRVNRHGILVMDSDKTKPLERINATKARMKQEVEAVGGYVWTTDRREIENEIPVEALRLRYGDAAIKQVGDFHKFSDYIEKVKTGEGSRFLASKVLFAEEVVPQLTKAMIEANPKLKAQLKKVIDKIKVWNQL